MMIAMPRRTIALEHFIYGEEEKVQLFLWIFSVDLKCDWI
jgi:hypothetical protein